MSRQQIILPDNCTGAFVAYTAAYDTRIIREWDDDEEEYIETEREVDYNSNGILLFAMNELNNITLQCYGQSADTFYWNNCLNCKYRKYGNCIGGISVYREGKCEASVSRGKNIIYVERDIPQHLMMFTGDYYYFFTEYEDKTVALSISNVSPDDGRWCTGEIEMDELDIKESYDAFWNCTRNGDLTPFLKINDKYKRPTLEELVRYWSPDLLLFDSSEEPDDCGYVSTVIDVEEEWLDDRQERLFLNFEKHNYYLTNYEPDSDEHYIELADEESYLIIE